MKDKNQITLSNLSSLLYPSSLSSAIPSPFEVADTIANVALVEPHITAGGKLKLVTGQDEERDVYTRFKLQYALGAPIKEGVSKLDFTVVIEYNPTGRSYTLDLGFGENVLVCSNGAYIRENIMSNMHKGSSQIGLKAFMKGVISNEAFDEAIGKIQLHNAVLEDNFVSIQQEDEFAGRLLRTVANKPSYFDAHIIRKALSYREDPDNAHKPISENRTLWNLSQDYTFFMKDMEIASYFQKHTNFQESLVSFVSSQN